MPCCGERLGKKGAMSGSGASKKLLLAGAAAKEGCAQPDLASLVAWGEGTWGVSGLDTSVLSGYVPQLTTDHRPSCSSCRTCPVRAAAVVCRVVSASV